MDFEEFLRSLDYRAEQINQLRDYFNRKEPISKTINEIYRDSFLKYACIGGFPKVVKEYVITHNIAAAYKVLESTVFNMKTVFGRRKNKAGNPVLNQRKSQEFKAFSI